MKRMDYKKLGLVIITIVLIIVSINPIRFLDIKDKNLKSLYSNYETSQLSSSDVDIVDEVLSQDMKFRISENSEINDLLSSEIIQGIDSGDFFKYEWEYSLDATYFGLVTLESLNRLDLINTEYIKSYLVSLFHASENCFYDDAYTYLNYSVDNKVGYSKVEATAYAILCMDMIGKLNDLTSIQKAGIISYLKNAINPIDGGFYHRTDGLEPNIAESSSVYLSYLCYSALIVLDPSPLNPIQITNLANFVKNSQRTSLPGFPEINGAFKDGALLNTYSLSSAYYAVSLLQSLNMLSSINSQYLIEHIGAMHVSSYGGVYQNSLELYMGYNASYSSTAIAMAMNQISGWSINIDEMISATYIKNGLLEEGYWPSRNGAKLNYLSDISIILRCFIESQNTFSSSEIDKIVTGMQSFLRTFNNYEQGFSMLPNYFGNIIDISDKLEFLNSYDTLGLLTEQQIEKILNFTDNCLYVKGLKSKFYKFPELYQNKTDMEYIHGTQPYYIYSIPVGVASGDTYGSGMQCNYAALEIYDILGKFDYAELNHNISQIASDIVQSQFDPDIYSGGFYPSSDIKSKLDGNPHYIPLYESPIISYYAVKSLEIIDYHNGTSYLLDVNSTSLKSYLKSFNISTSGEFYFENYVNPKSYENIKITQACYEINQIMSLNLYNPTEETQLINWITNHQDFPIKSNQNFDIESSTLLIQLFYIMQPSTIIELNLGEIRYIYENWFGINPNLYSIKRISNEKLNILRILLDEKFIEIKFYETPSVHINYTPTFKISAAGVSNINFEDHDIDIMMIADGYTSPWIQLSISASSEFYYVEISFEIGTEFFPSFDLLIRDNGPETVQIDKNLEIECFNNIKIDLKNINPVITVGSNEIITYSIGFYQDFDDYKNPVTISQENVTISLRDSSEKVIEGARVSIENLNIIDGQAWLDIHVNTSTISNRSYIIIELENELFMGSPDFVNVGEKIFNINTESDGDSFSVEFILMIEPEEEVKSIALIAFFGSTIVGGICGVMITKKRISNKPSRKINKTDKMNKANKMNKMEMVKDKGNYGKIDTEINPSHNIDQKRNNSIDIIDVEEVENLDKFEKFIMTNSNQLKFT